MGPNDAPLLYILPSVVIAGKFGSCERLCGEGECSGECGIEICRACFAAVVILDGDEWDDDELVDVEKAFGLIRFSGSSPTS